MIKGLPQKLKELRIANNLTQKTVARKLNISPSIVSGYETGERTPSTEILLALSYLYHCSTDYLLGRNDDKLENSSIICFDTSGLSQKQIQALSLLVDAMKEQE